MTKKLNARIALVVGSTGATGAQLIKRMLASDHVAQIVIVHYRPTQWATHPKVIEYQIKPDELGQITGLPYIDEVFCCLGTTIGKAGSKDAFRKVDHDYVIALAQWIVANHQPRLHLISAYGANAQSRAFYMRVKGEVEASLKTMGLASLVIYQPSLLHGERDEFRPAERIGFYALSVLAAIPLQAIRWYRPTRISALAEAMFQHSLKERKALTVLKPDEIAVVEKTG
ncbi:oxidoreductase [Elysia marginata]|uniref:Oxidoreductase n=1 Tax=Elysia marginata TaxID=1093978 RepID=A0AAV4GJ32_9GAST|nr:oxidoreductase [Elysia marginata]